MTLRCPHCGDLVDERDLHARLALPDPVLKLTGSERSEHVDRDVISVRGIGSFARVLLPIKMTGGYRLTLGTWLGFDDPQMFERAVALWHAPDYSQLVIEGALANEVKPWNALMGLRVRATVVQDDEVPYVTEVLSNSFETLVKADWDRGWVMAAFPDSLWSHRH